MSAGALLELHAAAQPYLRRRTSTVTGSGAP
jgi:hypothetical protein